MRKFFNSHLYENTFFTIHRIAVGTITINVDDISYDFVLLANYCQEHIEDEDYGARRLDIKKYR